MPRPLFPGYSFSSVYVKQIFPSSSSWPTGSRSEQPTHQLWQSFTVEEVEEWKLVFAFMIDKAKLLNREKKLNGIIFYLIFYHLFNLVLGQRDYFMQDFVVLPLK